jgi:hypothetical protein
MPPGESLFAVKGGERVLFGFTGALLAALRTVALNSPDGASESKIKFQWGLLQIIKIMIYGGVQKCQQYVFQPVELG